MGPLIFIARLHQIKRQKSSLQFRLMQATSQKQHITSQIGLVQSNKAMQDGIYDYMMQQQKSALTMQMSTASNYASMMDPMSANAYMGQQMMQYQWMCQQLNMQSYGYKLMQDEADKAQQAGLALIDQQIEQEITTLQAQIAQLSAEEQAVEKAMDQEIQRSAPKFA